jgi:hypothetical protein
MFPSYHGVPVLAERIRPDRRHVPTTESEIRLRIKRAARAV